MSIPSITPDGLKAYRLSLGLTQVQLAAELGLTELTISHWERGWPPGLYSTVLVLALAELRRRLRTRRTREKQRVLHV